MQEPACIKMSSISAGGENTPTARLRRTIVQDKW